MVRKSFCKRLKTIVAFSAITTLLMTSAVPISAISTSDEKDNITTQEAKQYRNVMYYGDWSIWGGQKQFYPKDIPADQLTHLNFSFVDFDENGELQFTDTDAAVNHYLGSDEIQSNSANSGILNAFKVLKQENPNLKIGVSLGGWSKSGDFSVVAADKTKRANFVKNVLAFIRYTNMDFVDIDWEYPAAVRDPDLCDNSRDEGTKYSTDADKDNFILLLQDFREALDKQGAELGKKYELTVALPAPIEKVKKGIDVKKLFEQVDFANIMTYDMRGAWDQLSGHQAGLYTNPKDPLKGKGLSIDESVKYYISQGAPSDKIVIGAAYYTRGWEKVKNENIDPSNPGLFGTAEVCTKDADGTPTTGANPEIPIKDGEGGRMTGVWSYNALEDLKKKYTGLKEYWDDVAKAPYLYNEQTGAFFTYDNARSIQEKAKYVKDNNLGGIIAWMASMDKKTTSTKRDELTKATKNALYGTDALPKYEVKTEKYPVSASVQMSKPTLNQKCGAFKLTVKNDATLVEKSDVLKAVESSAKTIKNAKLYIEASGVKIIGAEYPLSDSDIKLENGYYVIDLANTFTDKMIKPGESKSYNILVEGELEDLDGIISVGMTERMYKSSVEYGRRNIYGRASEEEIIQNGNYVPTISGIVNKKIYVGDKFDPMAGIIANDKEDGNLTNIVKVTGVVDVRKVGKYELTYSVSDSKGATRTAKVTVSVIQKTIPAPDDYDPKKVYNKGDRVVYKGIRYECLGYAVTNFEPGTNESVWKTIEKAVIIVEPSDVIDLAMVASRYNSKSTSGVWDEKCDKNGDGIIDLYDLVIVAKGMK
ncbi:MAG: glycosyl hydrolase family 18 protein [Clostridium sp.]